MTVRSGITSAPWFSRVFPFALYMAFIALGSGITFLGDYVPALKSFDSIDHFILYPIKTLVVAAALFALWKSYDEFEFQWLRHAGTMLSALLVGVVVFVLWINMDWPFATAGTPEGFNPYDPANPLPAWLSIAFRLMGAALVVPIFEELFWRSFILRYLINPDFTKVHIGTFTWMSFAASSVLFGLEHHLWLAGIMAGVFYNALLYRTKSLAACIVAHGVTNMLLGIYVLKTGHWQFW